MGKVRLDIGKNGAFPRDTQSIDTASCARYPGLVLPKAPKVSDPGFSITGNPGYVSLIWREPQPGFCVRLFSRHFSVAS
jgi:hypothetical protein